MSKTISKNNISKGWALKQFDDCIILPAKIKGLKKTDYKKFGKYPIFDQSQDYISGYTDQDKFLNKKVPAILFGDHTRILKYIESDFVLGADGTKVFWAKDNIDSNFLFYSLLNQEIPNTGYNRHFKYLKEKSLLLPPIKEQKKIAEILATVDEEIQKTDEIILRTEKMKNGLMQKIFKKGKSFKKIKDIFDIYVGKDLQKDASSDKQDKKHPYAIYANSLTNEGLYGYSSVARYKGDALTITARGEIGKAFFRDKDFDAIGRLLVLSPIVKQNCYFYTQYINSQIRFLIEKTGIAQLTAPKVAEYLLPAIDLEEQNRISNVLFSIDNKIIVNRKIKEKLTLLKKGLMQDLLNGKVRTT